jgi:hypothetical protein
MPVQPDLPYIKEIDDILLRSLAVTAADVVRIRALFTDLLDSVLDSLPAGIELDNFVLANVLNRLATEIDELVSEFEAVVTGGMTAQTELNQRMVEAYGKRYVEYGRQIPFVGLNPMTFSIISDFSARLITKLGSDLRAQVDRSLRLSALGLGGRPYDAIRGLNAALGGVPAWSARAEAIYRTETLRLSSILTQHSIDELNLIVPTDKMWKWSFVQRPEHARIDGQIRRADELFTVPLRGGGTIGMLFPRDPRASHRPDAVINCGCYHIPVPREKFGERKASAA